jgi:hypothetical protein
VPDRDATDSPLAVVKQVAKRPKLFALHLVCNGNEPDSRLVGRRIDQLGQPYVGSIPNIDHVTSPFCAKTF